MLEDAVKFLEKEWLTLRAVPFTFALLVVLTILCTRWYYTTSIATIESRHSREIDHFKERLGLAPRSETKYSKLTNDELKIEVKRVCDKVDTMNLRFSRFEKKLWDEETEAWSRNDDEYRGLLDRLEAAEFSGDTELEQQVQDSDDAKEYEKRTHVLIKRSQSESSRRNELHRVAVETEFRPAAWMLRTELLSRLPRDYRPSVYWNSDIITEIMELDKHYGRLLMYDDGVAITDLRQMADALP